LRPDHLERSRSVSGRLALPESESPPSPPDDDADSSALSSSSDDELERERD